MTRSGLHMVGPNRVLRWRTPSGLSYCGPQPALSRRALVRLSFGRPQEGAFIRRAPPRPSNGGPSIHGLWPGLHSLESGRVFIRLAPQPAGPDRAFVRPVPVGLS